MRLIFTLVSNLLISFHLLVLNTKHALLQNSILFFSVKLEKDRILVLWRKPLNMVRLTHGWVFWYPTVGRDFGDDGSGGVNRIPRLLNALLSYNRLKLGKWWGGGCLAVMGYCYREIGEQVASSRHKSIRGVTLTLTNRNLWQLWNLPHVILSTLKALCVTLSMHIIFLNGKYQPCSPSLSSPTFASTCLPDSNLVIWK